VLEPVLKKGRGFDYICLNINHAGKSIQLSCLGRHDRVKLPVPEHTRKKVEEEFGHKIDWDDLEGKIHELQKTRSSKSFKRALFE
jgi:predicted RNA-binding protein YlxR (DUF448 family)